MEIEHVFDQEQVAVLADLDRDHDEVSWAVTVDELEHGTADDSGIPGGLAELGPGPMLAAALSVLDADRVPAESQVVLLRALGRMIAHLQARSYLAMGRIWHAEDAAVADWPEGPELGWDSAVAEIGSALHLTRRAAEKDLGFVIELRRVPRLAEAFAAGRLDYRRSAVLGYGTMHLPEETARAVMEEIIDDAPRLTTGQLRARLRKLCVEADPADARRRYETAIEERRVVTEMNGDGTANLLAVNQPAEMVQAIRDRIFTLANQARTPGDHRTPDQRRSDVMIDLLLGTIGHGPTCRGGSVDLVVDLATLAGLTEAPGDPGGLGSVIADVARQITERQTDSPWTWSLVDPDTGG